MITPKNLYLGLKGQLPFKRAFRNFFITGNAWGMFHKNSHEYNGKLKIRCNTERTARKIADKMTEKTGKHFSFYKCIFCDGYHIGKNRDNK